MLGDFPIGPRVDLETALSCRTAAAAGETVDPLIGILLVHRDAVRSSLGPFRTVSAVRLVLVAAGPLACGVHDPQQVTT